MVQLRHALLMKQMSLKCCGLINEACLLSLLDLPEKQEKHVPWMLSGCNVAGGS